MTRRIFSSAFLIVLLLGCSAESDSSGAVVDNDSQHATTTSSCLVTPDTLDFGPVTTPPFGWEADYVTMSFTIVNAGDAMTEGRVTIAAEPAGERAARFALTPPETDPAFSLAPGDSVEFVIGVTMQNASGGEYSGTVDLGAGCGAIPLFMNAIPSQ